ncbi:putative emp24/gp25L/p24 family/GOLD [Blattamonas nauphoetae]|uniref:Emp24/gp25L/p24 family/GOLD n=1 Tax=Blattamonas nauphoetae TaxID=2049346 RepID=A0ABQ9YLF4_9EUKA|nr:putative emp24/gp25L/p24 family/GOLD [Blattamonas nauphoetae]
MKVISETDLPRSSYGIAPNEPLILSSGTIHVGPPDNIGTLFLFQKHLVFAAYNITEARNGLLVHAKNKLPHLPPSSRTSSLEVAELVYSAQSPLGTSSLSLQDPPSTQPQFPYIVRPYSTPRTEGDPEEQTPMSTNSAQNKKSRSSPGKTTPQPFDDVQSHVRTHSSTNKPLAASMSMPILSPHQPSSRDGRQSSPHLRERTNTTSPTLHPLTPTLLKQEQKKRRSLVDESTPKPTPQAPSVHTPALPVTHQPNSSTPLSSSISPPSMPKTTPLVPLPVSTGSGPQTTETSNDSPTHSQPNEICPSFHLPSKASVLHVPFRAYLHTRTHYPPPPPDEALIQPLKTPFFDHKISHLTLLQFILHSLHLTSVLHFVHTRSSAFGFEPSTVCREIPSYFLTSHERKHLTRTDADHPAAKEKKKVVSGTPLPRPPTPKPPKTKAEFVSLVNELVDTPLPLTSTPHESDWVPITAAAPSAPLASFKRIVNYHAPTNASIGPPSTRTRETQELHHFSPTMSVWTTRLDCLDVPYSTSFYYFIRLVLTEEELDTNQLDVSDPKGDPNLDEDSDTEKEEQTVDNSFPFFVPEVKRCLRIQASFDVVIVKPFVVQSIFSKLSTQQSVITDTRLVNVFARIGTRRAISLRLDWKKIASDLSTREDVDRVFDLGQQSVFSNVSATATSGQEVHEGESHEKSQQRPEASSNQQLPAYPTQKHDTKDKRDIALKDRVKGFVGQGVTRTQQTLQSISFEDGFWKVGEILILLLVLLVLIKMISALTFITTSTQQQIQIQQELVMILHQLGHQNHPLPQAEHQPPDIPLPQNHDISPGTLENSDTRPPPNRRRNCLLDAYLIPVKEGSQFCFSDDYASGVTVNLEYKFEVHQNETVRSPINPTVTVRDAFNKELARETKGSSGTVQFTTVSAGEHKLCIDTFSSTSRRQLYLTLNVRSGLEKTQEKISPEDSPEKYLRRLEGKLRMIQNEQQYYLDRHQALVKTEEKNSRRIVFYHVIQIGVVVLFGYLQLQFYLRFLKKRKII